MAGARSSEEKWHELSFTALDAGMESGFYPKRNDNPLPIKQISRLLCGAWGAEHTIPDASKEEIAEV